MARSVSMPRRWHVRCVGPRGYSPTPRSAWPCLGRMGGLCSVVMRVWGCPHGRGLNQLESLLVCCHSDISLPFLERSNTLTNNTKCSIFKMRLLDLDYELETKKCCLSVPAYKMLESITNTNSKSTIFPWHISISRYVIDP